MAKSTWIKWGIGGSAIVITSFYATLFALDFAKPKCPTGTASLPLLAPFAKYSPTGAAWVANLPAWSNISDSSDASNRSPVLVCEDSLRLGPAHSAHTDVATKGLGRFSHWGSSVVFSSSDNSDPNTNGRQYRVVRLQ
jgi:hypothetical protein